ncbi:unnamed protein product [Caenorhabditis nigoni]
MVQTRSTAAKNDETNADIKRKIKILEDQYSAAIEAHQKASDNVKTLQQKKEASSERFHRLVTLIVCSRRPYNTLVPMYRSQKVQEYRRRMTISKKLEKALKVENSRKEAMEDAEAVWKFEALFSEKKLRS